MLGLLFLIALVVVAGVVFQLKKVDLDDGQSLYCMWVSRDQSEPAEGGRSFGSLTMASSFNSTLDGITAFDQSSYINETSAISLGAVRMDTSLLVFHCTKLRDHITQITHLGNNLSLALITISLLSCNHRCFHKHRAM